MNLYYYKLWQKSITNPCSVGEIELQIAKACPNHQFKELMYLQILTNN